MKASLVKKGYCDNDVSQEKLLEIFGDTKDPRVDHILKDPNYQVHNFNCYKNIKIPLQNKVKSYNY